MRLNIFLTFLALIGAALLAYFFYNIAADGCKILKAIVISGFVTTFMTLFCGFGIRWSCPQKRVNMFIASAIYLIAFCIEHCFFAIGSNSIKWFLLTTATILLLYLFSIYGILKIHM